MSTLNDYYNSYYWKEHIKRQEKKKKYEGLTWSKKHRKVIKPFSLRGIGKHLANELNGLEETLVDKYVYNALGQKIKEVWSYIDSYEELTEFAEEHEKEELEKFHIADLNRMMEALIDEDFQLFKDIFNDDEDKDLNRYN